MQRTLYQSVASPFQRRSLLPRPDYDVLSFRVDACNLAPLDSTLLCFGSGERNQVAVIVAMVGEGNQAFMTAPVMPAQAVVIQAGSKTLIQNAFHIFFSIIVRVISCTIKEAGWRHLAGSPAITTCLPRAMVPIASHGAICDASSKITRSNKAWSEGRNWATESGLISMQGQVWPWHRPFRLPSGVPVYDDGISVVHV